MALPILDGNQSATTLSTILSSGQHIPAHTVVSLGTQAITDISGAVSGSVVSISNFPATQPVSIASVTIGNTVTISGTVNAGLASENDFVTIGEEIALGINNQGIIVTANVPILDANSGSNAVFSENGGIFPSYGLQVGFVDNLDYRLAGSSHPFPISGTVTVGNSVTIGSLPAISGTVTANTFALQGTAVTTSDFTSTTASTLLAGFNATREVLTIFNEGAGNLHVCAGATCTTIAYQVRLSAGDYYEVPNHQTTITHSAVFATAGTARVTQVS